MISPQSKLDRTLSQKSLYYLCKEVLGYKDMVPHVHGDLCYFATHPQYGRFRQATVPRSWFKTWILTVGKAIWLTLPDEDGSYLKVYPYKGPNVRTLIASYTIDLAAKMIQKIRQEWMTNDRLRSAFPELIPNFNKTRWSDHCAEVKRSIKAQEGTYTAVGVGGSVISQHFDHLIEDDLIYAKKDDFTGQELMPSQEDIDNAIGWHKLTFSLLANPQEGGIDNVGTRWAPHDLIDYIRKNEKYYKCFEINATRGSTWPVPDDSWCVWKERYDKKTLDHIRVTQGPKIFECFPQEAPILMSDWTTKSIKDIVVGDEVVGLEKGFGKYKSCLVKSTVNLVETMTKEVVKITLENGKTIRCTPDHPWYTGRWDKTHKPYMPAYVKGSLLKVYGLNEPTLTQLSDYRYLAGLIDGEGACSHGNIAIGQSKYANLDVYEGIESVLNRLSIPYTISTANPNESHTLRNKTIVRGLAQSFVLGGGRQVKGDIIRFGRPAKSNRILNTIWNNPCHPIKGHDKVISISPDGTETVYAIGTTTGNYVAYGYATKNTQYLNRPRAGEDVTFDATLLNKHNSLTEYPMDLRSFTLIDLASWGDKNKRLCRNVILTGAKTTDNHIWLQRIDAGRFNPTEVIEIMKSHQKQFTSRVLVEEVGYQIALRHFAKLDMKSEGSHVYNIDEIPRDGRRNAKELRIQSVEPNVRQGFIHILNSMTQLIQEMEDYPYGATQDILDVVGYLLTIARPLHVSPVKAQVNPFSIEQIEKELKAHAHASNSYPYSNPLADPFYVGGEYAKRY